MGGLLGIFDVRLVAQPSESLLARCVGRSSPFRGRCEVVPDPLVAPRARGRLRRSASPGASYPQADGGTRTPDPIITSDVLYQLSYVGECARGSSDEST